MSWNGFDAPFENGFGEVVSGMRKIRLERWTYEGRRIEIDAFLMTTPYQEAAFRRRARARIEGAEV